MATYTSHYNLKKPALSDKIRIADFNGNADTIDATMYDNATLIASLKSDIGIVENTNTATHNISSGQYVIWKGDLYTASSAISSGATLSDANLTAVSGGGLNALNSKIETVDIGDNFTSLSALETALNTFGASLENQEIKNIYVYFNSGASPFSSTGYIGSFVRLYADRYRVVFEENASDVIIIGSKNASGWNWNKLTLLKSGENSIGNVICAGYNTGSGNYVDFFIPFDTNGKTITSVSISSSSIVFLPAARVEFTNAPTITVLGTNDNGIHVEIQYSSTQTANVCAIVYAVNVKVTCS